MKILITGPNNEESEIEFDFTFLQYLQGFKVNLDLAGILFGTAFEHAYAPDWAYTECAKYRNPCFYLGNRLTGSVL